MILLDPSRGTKYSYNGLHVLTELKEQRLYRRNEFKILPIGKFSLIISLAQLSYSFK